MGGYGSTRWGEHRKKTTVEQCLVLDAWKLARDGLLGVTPAAGSLRWTRTATGEEVASVGFRREALGDALVFRVLFATTRRTGEREEVDQAIPLRTTPTPRGRAWWWFACPLLVEGRACGRRVRMLYLPPRSRYFGCRRCHDLTYRSCQQSHQSDRLLARIDRLLARMGDPERSTASRRTSRA